MSKAQIEDIVGLKSSLYDGIIAEQPMLTFNVDPFIAVHPKQGKKEEVKAALTKYKKYLETEEVMTKMSVSTP